MQSTFTLELSLFLAKTEPNCKKLENSYPLLLAQHSIEGVIVAMALANEKNILALGLANYAKNNKGKAHEYFLRIYEDLNENAKNFSDLYLGQGNVILSLTVQENLVVYFRMFDEVIFNTMIK